MTYDAARRQIQELLRVVAPELKVDGILGPKSKTAFNSLAGARDHVPMSVVRGKASSFADPADIRRFRVCKAEGKSDQECFKVGDNGIGLWQDDTTIDRPMCAIPRDDWQQFGNSARGRLIRVRANGREVVCELRDTMPWRKNIKNGAVIDLNPAAVKALGKTPPALFDCEWEWV